MYSFKDYNPLPSSSIPITNRYIPMIDSTRFDLTAARNAAAHSTTAVSTTEQKSQERVARVHNIIKKIQHDYKSALERSAQTERTALYEGVTVLRQQLNVCAPRERSRIEVKIDCAAKMLDFCANHCDFEELPKKIRRSKSDILALAFMLGDEPRRVDKLLTKVPTEWLNTDSFVKKIMPLIAIAPSICAKVQDEYWGRAHTPEEVIGKFGPLALSRVMPELRASQRWMLQAIQMCGPQAILFADSQLLSSATFALAAAKINPAIVTHLPEEVWFDEDEAMIAEHAMFDLECEHNDSAKRYNLKLIFGLREQCGDEILKLLPDEISSLCRHLDSPTPCDQIPS